VSNARTVILPVELSVLAAPTITTPAPSILPIETAEPSLTSPLEILFPPYLVKPRPVHNREPPRAGKIEFKLVNDGFRYGRAI
jgi:hypothetical protein